MADPTGAIPGGGGPNTPRSAPDLPGHHRPGACRARTSSTHPLPRWTLAIVSSCALLVTFAQAPGRIVSDTKLPLVMSPIATMSSALHLWDPSMWSGSIDTLGFGYLFPIGAYSALGHLLNVPVWCAERIWLALLLTTGFWGMVRLAEALGIGNRRGRLLGAVTYCIAPVVVTWASTTGALLAVVLLPWMLVPLVRGSTDGSPRRAAFVSGVAVPLMGGVNSAVVVATLPVGAVWLLTRQPGPRRRGALGLVGRRPRHGLLLVGRGPRNRKSLRLQLPPLYRDCQHHDCDWVALRGVPRHLVLAGPLHARRTAPPWRLDARLICRSDPGHHGRRCAGSGRSGPAHPERLFLVASLAVGVIVIAAGYVGPLGGPAAYSVQNLIGGPLAAVRNVSKFSPDVALSLALGFASITSLPLRSRGSSRQFNAASSKHPRSRHGYRRRDFHHRCGRAVLAAAAVPARHLRRIPSYWSQAARSGSTPTRTTEPRSWRPARPPATTPGANHLTSHSRSWPRPHGAYAR